MKTIIIDSEHKKDYCKSFIDGMPDDGSQTVVFKNTDKSPTARQRRLQWMWNHEVALSGIGQDDTKEDVHIRAKWMFARPILIRDDDVFPLLYETFLNAIETHPEDIKSQYAKEFSSQYISTERLTKEQRSEYLREFQAHWTGNGVNLTDPALQGLDLRQKY